jgi:hypothetical protein
VRTQVRLFLTLLLSLLVVSQLPLPFRLGGFVLALGNGWVGIRLMIGMLALRRAGRPVRGWSSVIVGLALSGALTLILAGQTALYPMTAERERCLAGANTLKAEATCNQNYQDRLQKLTRDMRNP